MRALLIDTDQRTVKAIELSENLTEHETQVKSAMRCETVLFAGSINDTLQLVVEENSLLDESRGGVLINFMPRPLFGNIMLLGRDHVTGSITDLPDEINVGAVGAEFLSPDLTENARREARKFALFLNEEGKRSGD